MVMLPLTGPAACVPVLACWPLEHPSMSSAEAPSAHPMAGIREGLMECSFAPSAAACHREMLTCSITDDRRVSQHFSTKKLDRHQYFRREMFDLVDFAPGSWPS